MQALLEEFGKWIKAGTSATQSERDAFYQAVYQEVYNVSHFFKFLEASSCHSCSGLMLKKKKCIDPRVHAAVKCMYIAYLLRART